jgi:hypothetical protein
MRRELNRDTGSHIHNGALPDGGWDCAASGSAPAPLIRFYVKLPRLGGDQRNRAPPRARTPPRNVLTYCGHLRRTLRSHLAKEIGVASPFVARKLPVLT